MRTSILGCAGAMLALQIISCSGCATSHGGVVAAGKASQATKDAFAKVQALEGEWETQDPESGKWIPGSVITSSSNGSIVREIMFPGAPHEMTNVYHLDGDTIVVTHYCAMGNQPRMRSTGMKGDSLHFQVSSVTNLADTKGMYMGDLKLTWKDADTIEQEWRSYDKGVLSDAHNVGIMLRRKRS